MGYTDVDAAESLLGAFCWDYSGESFPSESHIFWFEVYNYLRGATDTLPPIPTNKEGEE